MNTSLKKKHSNLFFMATKTEIFMIFSEVKLYSEGMRSQNDKI